MIGACGAGSRLVLYRFACLLKRERAIVIARLKEGDRESWQYLSAKWAVPAPTPVAAPTTRSRRPRVPCARSAARRGQASASRVPELRLLQEPRSHRDGVAYRSCARVLPPRIDKPPRTSRFACDAPGGFSCIPPFCERRNRSTLRGFDAPDLALARFLFAYRSMLPRRGRRCAASALAQYQVPQSLSLTDTRE